MGKAGFHDKQGGLIMSYKYKIYARFNINNAQNRNSLVTALVNSGYLVRVIEETNPIFTNQVDKYWVEVLTIDDNIT